jgi:hypothetical protein
MIQVKNYTGRIGPDVVDQLRTAHEHYSKEGTVLALIVMTTAQETAPELSQACDDPSKSSGSPRPSCFGRR